MLVSIRKFSLAILFFALSSFVVTVPAQHKMDRITKARIKGMLGNVKKEILKNYYDPEYHGMNVEERFQAAEDKLEQTDDLGKAYAVIAQAVLDLNDSHTRFDPPSRAMIVDYGFRMKMYGDRAFVTGVKEGSDADKKGLETGDEVLALNGSSRHEVTYGK